MTSSFKYISTVKGALAMDGASAVGGYRYTFIEAPSKELTCLICHLVARDPQQLLCCGKLCCNSCLQESKKHTNNCPQCRKRALTQEAAAARQAIERLKVQCNNSLDTEGQELGQHEANCDENAIIPCPNLCLIPSSPEAGEARYTTRTMAKKDLQNHLSECPRRKAICGYCGISGVYQWVANRHMLECTKLEVVCPNEGCEERVVHLYLPEHRQACLYESTPCRYETLGCTYTSPQKDRDEHQRHENNLDVHAGLMVASLLHKQHEQQAYFKINDFSYYQSLGKSFKYNADIWNWYILIETNGRGKGKGTHISVSLHWKQVLRNMPLWLNSVKLELLNHREDKNHFAYTFTDPDGLANEKFIVHTALGYKPSYNVLYLKDDTLCFRVTSEVINCKQLKPNTTL